MIERFSEFRVLCGVLFGVARDFGSGPGMVIIKEKRIAIERRSENARIGAQNLAIELVKLQVARYIGSKRTESVRKSRGAEAGMKLLGIALAANYFPAFENDRLERRPSQDSTR